MRDLLDRGLNKLFDHCLNNPEIWSEETHSKLFWLSMKYKYEVLQNQRGTTSQPPSTTIHIPTLKNNFVLSFICIFLIQYSECAPSSGHTVKLHLLICDDKHQPMETVSDCLRFDNQELFTLQDLFMYLFI